ncbi:MAG: glycosyltransferase family 2 protein [Thermodesulfobacteriota bacterium]
METHTPLISIVIPVYNEDTVIQETHRQVKCVMDSLSLPYEVIFIDDGSIDKTYECLLEIVKTNSKVKAIGFSRNFGHQAALTAGIDHAGGNVIITMDGDLQHPPELIPLLLEKWREGYEVVYTIREYGKDEGIIKKGASHLFYKVMNRLAQLNIPPGAADFKLFDKKVVKSLTSLKERARFLRGLSVWVGYRQTGVKYKAAPRYAGVSKYSPGKMIRLALDGITSFSIFPLKIATYMGFIVSLVSFIYLTYALYIKLIADKALPGWASVVIPMLFLGGIQLITIGILGEYIGRIYEEVKGRPIYIASKKAGF